MITLVNFYSYSGCSGSLHEMLVAQSSTGIRESTLYTRESLFGNYFSKRSLKRAKKRLLRKLKKKTGKPHTEMKTTMERPF